MLYPSIMTRSLTTRSRTWAVALLLALPASTVTAFSLISVNQEVELGRQAEQQVRQQVPELRDESVNAYVDRLGARLARHASGPKYPYRFSVANTNDLNAFALPGGPVWIHRGVLNAATNEAQVAGVMAHEIAHVSERHAAEQVTKAMATQGALGVLSAILGDGRGADATRVGAGLFANGLFLKFSRDAEREADREAVSMMRAAGYDPRGLQEFMQILRSEQRRNPSSAEIFLSTHPSPQNRIDDLERLVGGSGGRRTSGEFTQMKSRLRGLPPAQQMRRR